jgi:hypothetical protein
VRVAVQTEKWLLGVYIAGGAEPRQGTRCRGLAVWQLQMGRDVWGSRNGGSGGRWRVLVVAGWGDGGSLGAVRVVYSVRKVWHDALTT